MVRLFALAVLMPLLLGGSSMSLARQSPATPAAIAGAWRDDRAIDRVPPLLDQAAVGASLRRFVGLAPELFSLEEIGRSVEGRPIEHVWFGRGGVHVLLWSQMHGDEPTGTAALLDLLEHVRRHRGDERIARVLRTLTIHLVPMLNPDGAARFERRNAQGIDINRDALRLQSPEGRALKSLRDRLDPSLGFNLHNESWKTSAGKTGRPASISLLAVASDEAGTETAGRKLAKKICAVLRASIEALAPGQVARYDETFEVRAFGDNITRWGTPVVLIESGPCAGPAADEELEKLNFVAILSALEALASGSVEKADPRRYESLPVNDSGLFTLLVKNASVVVGTGVAPFLGDLGLGSNRVVRRGAGSSREALQVFRVEDLGDLRVFAGLETVDATGLVLAPSRGWTEGSEVRVADWQAFAADRPIAVGASVPMALLRQLSPGVYRVVRLIPAERALGAAR